MVILHISSISENPFNGVCVVVPQHIEAQQDANIVGLININGKRITGVNNQLECDGSFVLDELCEPFDRPDIVVFHEAYRVQYLRISKELRKRGIPYVIVPHGELTTQAQSKKWLKKKTANILLFNRFINGAEAIQCLSERELNATKLGKLRFVGTNGVKVPEIYKKQFRKANYKFIYVGRLEAHIKGLDLMLDAVAKSAHHMRENDSKLYMYGPDREGRYANVLSMITERKIEDIVILNHEITGASKEEALLDADIFIQTSRSEGMPLGVLEALSYGLPVLITEGVSLGDYVSGYDAGWVCETSSNAIAEKIENIFEHACLDEKSKSARKLVKEQFAWEIIANKTVEIYQKLC